MTNLNKQISDIILKNILTPVIYMTEFEDAYEFVCFCDRGILLDDILKTEAELSKFLNKNAIITDIRDFPEMERVEIVKKSENIYYEDEFIKQLFEISMFEDYKIFMDRRNSAIERMKNMGTPYLS